MLYVSCHETGFYVILAPMKTLIAQLKLSPNLQGRTRERCPNVVWMINGKEVAAIRTDVEHPALPLTNGDVDRIEILDDALSRVMDEAAWLAECQRVLAVDGEIRFTLPASGALAWLDTMNMYRYTVDIGKRGDQPDAALPTGWNRHYSPEDISLLLHDAGFVGVHLQSANFAANEVLLFTGLVRKNWIGGDRKAESEMFPRYGRRAFGKHRSPIRTTWSISARKGS